MKSIITIKFLKVRNALTGRDVIIDEQLSKDEIFQSAVEKNLKIICNKLEEYFRNKRIYTKFSYTLEDGR